MPDFLLPDLGEGLEDAEIVTWHVGVGDPVEVDQIVVEVETAKALVAVPTPVAGVVSVLHGVPGSTVAVGTPLISVVTEPEEPPGRPEAGVATPGNTEESSGNVLIGYGTTVAPRRDRRGGRYGRRAPHRTPVAASTSPGPAAASAPPASVFPASAPPVSPAPGRPGPVRVISPVVRRLAREAGLDLTRVTGTGPAGLVRRHDVERELAATPKAPARGPAHPAAPAAGSNGMGTPGSGATRIPIRGLRRAVADKLSRSRREIPEATVWVDVDATDLLAARAVLNARDPRRPVGLTALIARFALLGLRRHPELNARVEVDEIVIPDHVHLGFAAQTDRGLVVPVVRDAHRLTLRELSAALAERTDAARSGGLVPSDLTGGTITINNYGVFGVDGSAAIINHPEVAILGIGRIIDRPWVVDGRLAVRKVAELTLAFDHRVCDGGTAGGFLRFVADRVESPVLALGEL